MVRWWLVVVDIAIDEMTTSICERKNFFPPFKSIRSVLFCANQKEMTTNLFTGRFTLPNRDLFLPISRLLANLQNLSQDV